MKKILIFSPPFSGHLRILKEFVSQYKSRYSFKLVVTGWKDLPPDLDDIKIPITVLAKHNLPDPNPGLFTLPLAVDHFDNCLHIITSYKPHLVIYDFQALAGKFAADKLSIPNACSIPSFLSRFDNTSYLSKMLCKEINKQSIGVLVQKYRINISPEQFETIDNCLYLPGEHNIVWSYKSLQDPHFMYGRHKSRYLFVGNISAINLKRRKKEKNRSHIYISLGTALMNIIWNRDKNVRYWIKQLIFKLSELWNENSYDVIFVSQGKTILHTYPKNWHIYTKVNQISQLASSDIFVTHGGNNSFNEAVIQNIPMVVVPFFGDQIYVGRRVDQLKIGTNILNSGVLSLNNFSKEYAIEIAEKIDLAVKDILSHKNLSSSKFKKLSGKTITLDAIIESTISNY